MSIIFPILLLVVMFAFPLLLRRLQLAQFGYWLLGSYFLLLIAGVIAYLFIPTDTLVDGRELSERADERRYMIHEVIDHGVQLESFAEYKTNEWEFDIGNEKNVSLYSAAGYHHYYFPIIVKRVADQEMIQVAVYEIEPELPFESIGNAVYVPDVSYEAGIITVIPPGYRLYRYSEVLKEFPFKRFSDFGRDYFFGSAFELETVFYITIPENINFQLSPEMDAHWLN